MSDKRWYRVASPIMVGALDPFSPAEDTVQTLAISSDEIKEKLPLFFDGKYILERHIDSLFMPGANQIEFKNQLIYEFNQHAMKKIGACYECNWLKCNVRCDAMATPGVEAFVVEGVCGTSPDNCPQRQEAINEIAHKRFSAITQEEIPVRPLSRSVSQTLDNVIEEILEEEETSKVLDHYSQW